MTKIKLKSLIESLVRKTLQENSSAEQNVSVLIDYAGDDTKMLHAIKSILEDKKMQELLKDTLKDTEMQILLKAILESPGAISMALISIRTELENSERTELEDSEDFEDSKTMSSSDFGIGRDLDRATGVKSPR